MGSGVAGGAGAAGEKCLEIKEIQGKPYVYRSTSAYDKVTKSPKKVSTYLGRLTKDQGLIAKGRRRQTIPMHPRSVRAYGNFALMAEEFGEVPGSPGGVPGLLAGDRRSHLHPDRRIYPALPGRGCLRETQ